MSQQQNNPQAGQGRPLPKKESDMFRSVIKFYETKLYKKGIKSADGILKKFPKHGETLAMKGLILNCLNRKEEAHELVKMGLMNDMRSHVCWHVYGLLYRSDRNYNEAIKAYKQALRIDKDNLQILRDLSLLQIQMRDLAGYEKTRHQILNIKPNQKVHWLSFALAKHLCHDPSGCLAVIDSYLGTLDDDADEKKRGFESSELAMYKYEVMCEIPNNEKEALDYLDKCRPVVVDQTSWLSAKARGQLFLGDYEDARKSYIQLFDRGSTEDYQVHTGYMCSLLKLPRDICDYVLNTVSGHSNLQGMDTVATVYDLSDEQKTTLLDAYTSNYLVTRYPISKAIKRIPLTLMDGSSQEFKDAVDGYCKRNLRKGVPSLGNDLSYLLLIRRPDGSCPPTRKAFILATDPVDIKVHPLMTVFKSLSDSYLSSLNEKGGTFPGSNDEESPSTYLWALFLRSKLHELCGEYTDALQLINKAIEHTPTLVDLYEAKGRILKWSGDMVSAYESLEQGRELDLQDRYINNKAIKYMLRAGKDDLAKERVALFTKDEGNPEQHMFDMQGTWYELELAACYAQKKNWGKALKKYAAVESHFEDYHEDQFDFHSYCVRKVTLRVYVSLLKFEDTLWSHKFYQRAAAGLIQIYLHLVDHPEDAKEGSADEPDYSKMTAAQKKKARKKKKQQEKQQQQTDGSSGGNNTTTTPNNNKKKSVDEDPNGAQLLALDAMEEAIKYSNSLVMHAPKCAKTWLLRYDVAIRRKNKDSMALQALFKAKAINPTCPKLFLKIVDYTLKRQQQQKETKTDANSTTVNGDANGHTPSSVVQNVLEEQSKVLLGGLSLQQYIKDAVEKVKLGKQQQSNPYHSLPWYVAVADAMSQLPEEGDGGFTQREALSILAECDLQTCQNVSVKTCKRALSMLRGLNDTDASKKFTETAMQIFPLSKDIEN